jgi:hypothetical protein
VASAALLLLAACNSAARPGGGGSTTPSGAPPTAPSSDAAGCPTQLTITAADNGRTACVALGGTVLLTSPTPQANAWAGPGVAGGALRPAQTTPPVPAGTTVISAYTAVNPGTAILSAIYRNCPPQTGAVSCNSIIAWSATVQVK